jgi:hypothetical protein
VSQEVWKVDGAFREVTKGPNRHRIKLQPATSSCPEMVSMRRVASIIPSSPNPLADHTYTRPQRLESIPTRALIPSAAQLTSANGLPIYTLGQRQCMPLLQPLCQAWLHNRFEIRDLLIRISHVDFLAMKMELFQELRTWASLCLISVKPSISLCASLILAGKCSRKWLPAR